MLRFVENKFELIPQIYKNFSDCFGIWRLNRFLNTLIHQAWYRKSRHYLITQLGILIAYYCLWQFNINAQISTLHIELIFFKLSKRKMLGPLNRRRLPVTVFPVCRKGSKRQKKTHQLGLPRSTRLVLDNKGPGIKILKRVMCSNKQIPQKIDLELHKQLSRLSLQCGINRSATVQ